MKLKYWYSIVPAVAFLSGCNNTPAPSPVAEAKLAHENYLKANASDYDWFANASDGYGGVPLILLRSLPDLAPDIWGKPEERFASFGYLPNKDNPNSPLPLGLSWDPMVTPTTPQPLHPVALTCGACHIGRVRLENGDYMQLVGGPNTSFDVRKWRKAFESTVHKMMMTPQGIQSAATQLQTAIASKPANYFYGNYRGVTDQMEAGERAYISSNAAAILTSFAGKILLGEAATNKEKATSYSKSNAPPLDGGSPGQSDGSGDLIPRLLLLDTAVAADLAKHPEKAMATIQSFGAAHFAELPEQLATVTDILSTWNEGNQHFAQIDGSVKSPIFRNVAASLAVAGDPTLVNIRNADITAKFISHLPAPAYPFALDAKMVERGKEIFKNNCATCHKPFNDNLYPVDQIGTDGNRSRVLNAAALTLFVRHFIASAPADYVTTDSDGKQYKPHELAEDQILSPRTTPATQGYVTNGLDGLWARAPYLHNGSVPTLYHLLVPSERPAKFMRAAVSYDPAKVGFQWDIAKLDSARATDPTAAVFDTSWDSASNSGHNKNLVIDATGKILRSGWDGAQQPGELRVRLDWGGADNKDALADLLEYLKTL